MGVAGLWDILKPAAKTRSLTELAVVEGFQANPRGLRGYRIGIDASIWFFHAEYGKEGENPVLRTLFFRCATLMKAPFLPLFVFDGPRRPAFKRGKRISKADNKLIPGMKRIVEAFGFEWRMAPGEAEAELAYLNRVGVIDGILSDDVDNFLFGALTVIRNQSNNLSGNKANPILNSEGRDDKNHTRIFLFQDIRDHPDIQLTRGGFILIGLLRGGDYEQGLEGCGITTAHALARCGFGDSLYEAACDLSLEGLSTFLEDWRQQLRRELKTNSRGFLPRKCVALSKSIPDTFPKIEVLLSYVQPITSESLGHAEAASKITWSKDPNVSALAGACELFFEWGYREAIIKRFRTVIWPGAVLRILRRAVLDVDNFSSPSVSQTPRRAVVDKDGYGTPSKMIAKHFSAIRLGSDDEPLEEASDKDPRLITSISRERAHASTDGLPEYRLEVAPDQLVQIAESGLQGLRQPEGPNEWAYEEGEDEEDGETGQGKNGKNKGPVDPLDPLRLWMPACMVDIVEKKLVKDFKDVQGRKKQKKRVPPQKKSVTLKTSSETASRKTKSKATPSVLIAIPESSHHTQTLDDLPPHTPSRLESHPPSFKVDARKEEEEESLESEGELPTIPAPKPTSLLPSRKPPTSTSNKSSRANRVATMFKSPMSASLPSPKTIENNLTLSDSEEELPADVYQTIQPKATSNTSSQIRGYISLSDSSDGHIKPTSLTSWARKGNGKKATTQRTLSSNIKQISREKCNESEADGSQQIFKSPKKSKIHISPRNEGLAKKSWQPRDSVISISDEDSDVGYLGASQPNIAPLRLARARTKEKVTVLPRCPKPTATEEDIIDLT